MRILLSLAIAIPALLVTACSSNDGDDGDDGDDGATPDAPVNPMNPDAPTTPPPDGPPNPACVNLAGSWAISGGCGADLCTFTQANCDITGVSCISGAQSTSGDVTGSSFTYTGTSGGGVPATCTGTVTGNAMSGSCVVNGAGSCPFTGTRQ